MRWRNALAALGMAGCHASVPDRVVPVASCSAARPTDGFGPLDGPGGVQFVAAAADDPQASESYAAFAQGMHGLERRTPETADRAKNLIVLGRFETNALVASLTGPVNFERGRFRFGGHVYDDPDDGIAILLPSPFAAGRYVLAYVGNSPAGLTMTQSVPTGDHQFTVVGAPIGVQQEGDFCDGRYYAGYAVDRRADWEAFRATLGSRTTAHHTIYFEHGTKAERDLDRIADELERDYAGILKALDVPALDHPIVTYLWSDREKKKRYTGDPGNGVAIGNAIHALYTDDVSALGPHEYVHVIAGARWKGEPPPLWSEGLAVAVGGDWNGTPLPDAVRQLEAAGKLPSLDKLLCCFRDIDDNVSYPIAGHFVQFVLQRFGLAKLKQLYAAPDPVAVMHDVLGVDAKALEAEWLASVGGQPR